MSQDSLKARAENLLKDTGIHINGDAPTDIQIHDDRLFSRVFAHGTLGFGEAYMDGWWDTGDLPGFFTRLLSAHLDERLRTFSTLILHFKAKYLNSQRGSRSFKVGQVHYDTGNDLFSRMLGKYLMYSSGYWKDADNLDDSQEAKLDLICRKLNLQPGQKLLDIGCGWGVALKFAAEHYGVEGVGVTVSVEQAKYGREICKGLPVEIRVQDYREVTETFDGIYSIGMLEHVGGQNYRTYFEMVRRCLKPNGLFVVQCCGSNATPSQPDPWIEKYIFPNSVVPAASQVTKALENLFVVEDWHNFGADYDRTLMAWIENFDAAWPEIKGNYDERFRRMWHFYLGCSAAVFRCRRDQLWQLTLSADGVPGGYRAPR